MRRDGRDGGMGADQLAESDTARPSGSQPAEPQPEMPARRIKRLGRWPARDEPGQFVVRCSCRRWVVTGTAEEIAAASRAHDDSPCRHVVHIWGKVAS